ncbi:hypothetical protein NIES4071_10910 [Calothrix sp. NIES-4071]|nr:hypothetical protein NIES4071_10910 [Calothrix sp. NIES-4071]BAZ55431.1 hypothetical protein NIES4105_10870 [Calothrix sp. NIES-4105]
MYIFTSGRLAVAIAMPLTIVGWFFSALTLADTNFSLNQLLTSTQTSPESEKLINQISSNLRNSKIKPEQVQCTGTKLTGRHSLLSGAVAPFDCRFSKKVVLKINAQNFVILPSGRVTPLENAKNLDLMPKPIALSYKITSWNWDQVP